jgi:putative FmdB family regulatory protein
MPTIDYRCETCRHTFSRLVFRGDEDTAPICPACGGQTVAETTQAESLFDGISPASSLAKDRN